MSWFKNQWDKGGANYPSHIKDSVNRWLEGGDRNERGNKKFLPQRERPQIFSQKVGDAYYYMSFPSTGDNFANTDLRIDTLKAGTDDEVTDSFLKAIQSHSVPAFIGDTLEIDDDHTKNDSPFTDPPLNTKSKSYKFNKVVVTSLDVIKTVLLANTDKLSLVIIGNHEDVTEGNIYQTEADKTAGVKLNITLSSFMKQRAEIYQRTFFSGLTNVITMGADDAQNTYDEDGNTTIPANARKFLKPGQNREGISVIYLLKGASDSVRH